jgi:SAM-dependent methyltransferase
VECYYSTNVAYYDYLFHDHLVSSEVLLESVLSRPQLEKPSISFVLDACCGSGHDVEFLLRRGFDVEASDLCPDMLDYAEARVKRVHLSARFFQSDVLELSEKTDQFYDLVLFRGNTLGHLSGVDQLKAVQQLYDRTKPGKFLLLDFRDGRRYHREQKRFELRGRGIDWSKRLVYFSYYGVVPSIEFSGTYRIRSKVLLLNLAKLKFSTKSQTIDGHYVDVAAIIDHLLELGCDFEFIESDGRCLPYLKTVLVSKGKQ